MHHLADGPKGKEGNSGAFFLLPGFPLSLLNQNYHRSSTESGFELGRYNRVKLWPS